MIVVLFEFEPDAAYEDRYFELAGLLRENVEKIEALSVLNALKVFPKTVVSFRYPPGKISTP